MNDIIKENSTVRYFKLFYNFSHQKEKNSETAVE